MMKKSDLRAGVVPLSSLLCSFLNTVNEILAKLYAAGHWLSFFFCYLRDLLYGVQFIFSLRLSQSRHH